MISENHRNLTIIGFGENTTIKHIKTNYAIKNNCMI